ncbi:MAG: acylneuraminate cytidylyltransferase family protein [Acidobacteriota bacterium]
MKLLGVVTARGGSKGIPGKNLKLLAGRPLIVHTIESARASGVFDRLILSTDDPAIADEAVRHGCEVPFLRPAALAHDDTPHLPVLQHAVAWLRDQTGYQADAVMILQPTSPLRRAQDISEAYRLLKGTDADSVLTVSEVSPHAHPLRMLRVGDDGLATLFVSGEPVGHRINRRQDLPPAWLMDGAIYAFRTRVLDAEPPSLYGRRTRVLPVPHPYGLSLDDSDDWRTAEEAIAALTRAAGRG